jgi:hypothetical protein
MIRNFYRSLVNSYKQFGLFQSLSHIILRVISKLYYVQRMYVYVIPYFKNYDYIDDEIKVFNKSVVSGLLKDEVISTVEFDKFNSFLNMDMRGFYILKDKQLAGYSWIQYGGDYNLCKWLSINITKQFAVFRNLYVNPQFRGLSLGKRLNKIRLANIDPEIIPVGFVIAENKYAKRNLEKYGFQTAVQLNYKRFFSVFKIVKHKFILKNELAVDLFDSISYN